MPAAGEDSNATNTGAAPAMYVPTMGMNSATNPSKIASGAANGTLNTRSVMYMPVPLITARSRRE